MLVPPNCHWYESGDVPAAPTVNVAVLPAGTVQLVGGTVKIGIVGPGIPQSLAKDSAANGILNA
jgi:hypothetical protein